MTEDVVTGRDVTIRIDAQRCIHSRTCVPGHPEVHVPNGQGEWIHPDAAGAEVVMHAALACPSGAIRVARRAQRDSPRPESLPPRSSRPWGCETAR
jgi:uncharacterized Fe-S cluster protein YjdI